MEIIDERRKMNDEVYVLWLLEDNIYNIDGMTNDYNYI